MAKRHLLRTVAVLMIASAAASLFGRGRDQGDGQGSRSEPAGLTEIQDYISKTWNALTRSMTSCRSISDPKALTPPVIYLPADFAIPATLDSLNRECRAQIGHLPRVVHGLGEIDGKGLDPHALLYLPHPYVVPGGIFNEMYGWDSYFIIRGLVESNRLELARGMVENFFFEISHYGGVLNANRAYLLTRSQPPFLTSMILAVYEAEKAKGRDDHEWLEEAYPYALRDYDLWVHAPHLAGTTGLSRYFDFGEGPAPEESPLYYRGVAGYFILHPSEAPGLLATSAPAQQPVNPIGPQFSLKLCDERNGATATCDHLEDAGLTADFYKGDRSVRESGFDITFRFGPYGARTHHYAALGLNCLLYKLETDLERISALLGKQAEARNWRARAARRRETVNKYLWNGGKGEFFDHDFETNKQSSYEFATTFYPLWVGLASPDQAEAVDRNFRSFNRAGGLLTSLKETGGQWDAPYGWAPLQLIAAEGLRRYGFTEDANRLAAEFLSTVLLNFQRDGTIREKYNVLTRSSETHIQAGYKENVVGFGWTNAVFLVLLHSLPEAWSDQLPLR